MFQQSLILPVTLLFIGGANAQAAGLPVRNITGQNPWINLPAKLPKYARTLPKNLLGLSIEMDQWPQWAGTTLGSPNKFVNTVLNNIASRTGYAVNLRVGAFPFPEATYVAIGKDFYALSANMPAGTDFTWGLNLRVFNASESVAQAVQLVSLFIEEYDTFYGSRAAMLKNVTLKLIELGNEPDLYFFRGAAYNNVELTNYTQTWISTAGQILSSIDLTFPGAPGFQIGAWADAYRDSIFTVAGTLGTGILDSAAGALVKSFSVHNYFGRHTGDPVTEPKNGQLMGRSTIRGNVTRFAAQVPQAEAAGMDYVLGETNSFSSHGSPGLSDSAEAALWLVDFSLQLASVGVNRIYFHEGVGFAYNLIQPVPIPGNGTTATSVPRVQAAYYGALMVAEAIGTGANTKVAELPSNSTSIAAYGIWENERLARAVIINSDVYFAGATNGTRSSKTVSLGGYSNGKTSIKRLTAPGANSTEVLWAGQNFTLGDPTGSVRETWLNSSTITLEATEAVLLCFK
ncbi:hypothetical protein QFC21_006233 [Naganishia friedmannii]|uniref:Uncharacterized protein n=1 Tax=Naganishia friedmannii TaxID=89922 RepID=A0ACC2V449_9TREE|nr:hypothetical protein QFC21_006233 [Naganishia friedmannii]